MRRKIDPALKAKVAHEAIKGEKTVSEIASHYGVHPNQVTQWRKKVLESLPEIFSKRKKTEERETEELIADLYRQIGQMTVENDWLKKKYKQINK
jgi:transposase-like protein